MKSKILIVTGFIFLVLFISGLITSYIDNARIRAGIEPKYTIKIIREKGSKVIYMGLGYKVVRYVGVSPEEPFGVNDNYKYGSWFMKYENPDKNKLKIEEIHEYINDYLENIENVKLYNYVYSYIDEANNKLVVGLVDNTKEEQEKFINDVFTSCCGAKYIKSIKENNYIVFEESKEFFKGKVIETKDNSILVKVVNKSKSFNKGDKVLVHILNYKYKNIVYEKDIVLTIKFNGLIENTNPPQVSSTEIVLDINDYK